MFEHSEICLVVAFQPGLKDTFKRVMQQERKPDNTDPAVQKGCQSWDTQGCMCATKAVSLFRCFSRRCERGGFHDWNWFLLRFEVSRAHIQFLFFSQAVMRRCNTGPICYFTSQTDVKSQYSTDQQFTKDETAVGENNKHSFGMEWVEFLQAKVKITLIPTHLSVWNVFLASIMTSREQWAEAALHLSPVVI